MAHSNGHYVAGVPVSAEKMPEPGSAKSIKRSGTMDSIMNQAKWPDRQPDGPDAVSVPGSSVKVRRTISFESNISPTQIEQSPKAPSVVQPPTGSLPPGSSTDLPPPPAPVPGKEVKDALYWKWLGIIWLIRAHAYV